MSQVFKHQHVRKQTEIQNDQSLEALSKDYPPTLPFEFLWREKIKQTWKYLSEIVSPLKVSLETKKTKLLWSWKTICLKDGNEQNNFDIYKKRSKHISFIQFSIFIQPKLLIFSLFFSSSAKFSFLKQSKVWEKEIVCRLTKSPLKYICTTLVGIRLVQCSN